MTEYTYAVVGLILEGLAFLVGFAEALVSSDTKNGPVSKVINFVAGLFFLILAFKVAF